MKPTKTPQSQLEYLKKYRSTEKGKAATKRYLESEKGKRAQKKGQQKAREKRGYTCCKCKEVHATYEEAQVTGKFLQGKSRAWECDECEKAYRETRRIGLGWDSVD